MTLPLRLALAVSLGLLAAPLAAHPLPGSTLTLSGTEDGLALSIALPLHELELAMPGGTGLGDAPADGAIASDATKRLGAYMADHLALAPAEGPALAVTLTAARIAEASNEHVGTYDLLVLDLTAPVAEGQTPFPLTLRSDAVMHQVRNHRTAVLWQTTGTDPVQIGEIRIDSTTGTSTPITLLAPP